MDKITIAPRLPIWTQTCFMYVVDKYMHTNTIFLNIHEIILRSIRKDIKMFAQSRAKTQTFLFNIFLKKHYPYKLHRYFKLLVKF